MWLKFVWRFTFTSFHKLPREVHISKIFSKLGPISTKNVLRFLLLRKTPPPATPLFTCNCEAKSSDFIDLHCIMFFVCPNMGYQPQNERYIAIICLTLMRVRDVCYTNLGRKLQCRLKEKTSNHPSLNIFHRKILFIRKVKQDSITL